MPVLPYLPILLTFCFMDQDICRKLDRITDTLWAGGVTNPVTYIEPNLLPDLPETAGRGRNSAGASGTTGRHQGWQQSVCTPPRPSVTAGQSGGLLRWSQAAGLSAG